MKLDLKKVKFYPVTKSKEISGYDLMEIYNIYDWNGKTIIKDKIYNTMDFYIPDMNISNIQKSFQFNPVFNPRIDGPKLCCDNCDSDCCGPTIFRGKDEVLKIFNICSNNEKYPEFNKIFPGKTSGIKRYKYYVKLKELLQDHYRVVFRLPRDNWDENDSCIFRCSSGCSIYDLRPAVCKIYGQTDLLRCPFQGLDSKPESKDIQIERTKQVHEYTSTTMASRFYLTNVKTLDKGK